ncbi:IPT/TIG domain-containing protein [Kitasatospora kifunensis]|uniref:IPT/TIG domain-containing protein n=1 Tax=Kitasatospora kifunensis TaxID=58351 RepID=A0A7W7W003_KITKI|nr:IPT/TIG domain-containing protein [Kitasatospora kifunensis]MBB4928663.1 hypothetical protein [Kitasatospora kifunensis]
MKIARTLACSLLVLASAVATALPAAAAAPAGQDEAVLLGVEGMVPGSTSLVNVAWSPGGAADTNGPTQITLDVPAGFKVLSTQLDYSWPVDHTWSTAISPDGRHLTATYVGAGDQGLLTFMEVYVSTPTTVPLGVFTAAVSHRNDTNLANNVASETTTHVQLTPVIPPAPKVKRVDGFFGPGVGGTPVTITGEHLRDAMVLFGDTPAASASCTDTKCTATTPSGLGVVPVSVVTPGGTVNDAGLFGYYGPPPAAPAPVFGASTSPAA